MNEEEFMKITLLLFLGLLFTNLSVSANGTSSIVFSDTLNGKEITRNENFLVYYAYNSTQRSPANQWGYEISVNENNVVVEVATNVTILPNGYAISGHGTKKESLMNVMVGDIVEIDHTTLSIDIIRDQVQSSMFKAQINIEKANEHFQMAKLGFYSFDQDRVNTIISDINSKYQEMEIYAEKENITADEIETLKSINNEINSLTEDVIYMTSKSNNIEIRALWHRPNATDIKENSLNGVIKFVTKVKELGFNTLYVETLWNGFVSYRSEILETHPQLATFYYGEEYQYDYIAALIGEANKLDIDVHAWNHTFNAGNSVYKASAVKDEWLVENYQGDTLHPNAYGGSYYLDPSNEEVLDFVESVFIEMVTNYNFAGIQLDYIRYYDNNYSQAVIRDSGYGELAETKFKEKYNLEGDVRNLILNTSNRELWNQWRQDNITEAVRRLSNSLKSNDKDIVISADVVANINIAKATYMQDWKSWVDKGYIDLLCPMIYTGSSEAVYNQSIAIKNGLKNLSFLSSGIAPIYYGYSVMTNHDQVSATSLTGGSAIFASQNVIGIAAVENSLKNGLYRTTAVSPLSSSKKIVDEFVSHEINYFNQFLEGYEHLDMFIEKLEEIKNAENNNPSDYQEIKTKLEFLSDLSGYLNNEVIRLEFISRIENVIDILDIKISRELISLGFYDPTNGPRPNPDDFEYESSQPVTPNDPQEPSIPNDPTEEPKKGCLDFSFLNSSIVFGFGLIYLISRRKGSKI